MTSKPKGQAAATPGGRQTPSKEKKLTDLQERFCEEYLVDLSPINAARRAGYKDANKGRQLVTLSNVEARIDELKAARSARTRVTTDYVLENLMEITERCMQRAPVMVKEGRDYVQLTDDEGRHVWEFNSKGALGALKMMGDHLGMFRPQLEPADTNAHGLPATTGNEELTDEQLQIKLQRLIKGPA